MIFLYVNLEILFWYLKFSVHLTFGMSTYGQFDIKNVGV